jgi:hypothetical protein
VTWDTSEVTWDMPEVTWDMSQVTWDVSQVLKSRLRCGFEERLDTCGQLVVCAPLCGQPCWLQTSFLQRKQAAAAWVAADFGTV